MGLWTPSEVYEDRLQIATHHEAGHAVLTVLLGFELVEVTAYVKKAWFGDPEMVGWTNAADILTPDDDPELWDNHMIVAFGGSQAEELLCEDWDLQDPSAHAYALFAGDAELIAEAGQYASLSEDAARDEAFALLEESWDAVSVVAEALRENASLSGADVENLIL